jgi:hypothetical protein
MESRIYGYDPASAKRYESKGICPSGSVIDRFTLYGNADAKKLQGMEVICSDGKKYLLGNYNENMQKYVHDCRDQGYSKLDIFEDKSPNLSQQTIYGLGLYCQKEDLNNIANNPKHTDYHKYYTESPYPSTSRKTDFTCPDKKKLVGVITLTNKAGIDTIQLICEGDNTGSLVSDGTSGRSMYELQDRFWYFLFTVVVLILAIFFVMGMFSGFDPYGSKRLGR